MNIGQAAKASGISATMIRYYESVDLIPPVGRTEAGYRVYSAADVHALTFVHRARSLGFSVDQMRALLSLWRDRGRASADVKAVALAHVAELDEKIEALETMRETLQYLVEHCHGDHRPDCSILEDLSEGHEPEEPPKRSRNNRRKPRHIANVGVLQRVPQAVIPPNSMAHPSTEPRSAPPSIV